jgi:hypothetical protein
LAVCGHSGVSMAAGSTVHTSMPVLNNSWRTAEEKPRTACLEATYALT